MKLEKIKQAFESGALVKKYSNKTWTWAIPMVQQTVMKSDVTKKLKVGDLEWVVSEKFLDWNEKQRSLDKANYINRKQLDDFFVQLIGEDGGTNKLEQVSGEDGGPRSPSPIPSEPDSAGVVEELPF